MEQAAIASPLSDDGLRELGRLAVNFGYAEMLLDNALSWALAVPGGQASTYLIAPLVTRRKIEILLATAKDQPEPIGDLTRKACELIQAASSVRNDVLHGFWGVDEDGPISITAKKPTKGRRAEEMSEAADKVAIATRLLHTCTIIRVDANQRQLRSAQVGTSPP